jgi:signal transduction histidine kinase
VILGPLAEAQLMIVLLVGFAFFLFTSRSIRILCTVISVLLLAVMEANFKFHLIHSNPVSTNVAYGMRWTSYFVIISLVALLFYLFDKNYEKLLNKQTLISLKKSNLIRTAFHEIRSEFKGMKMILSVLASNEELLQTEGMSKVLGDLRNGSEKIEMVIGNLLNYSKGEAGIVERPLYEPLNLKLILKNMADINQYFANKKGVRIVYQAAGDVPEYLISDRFKINQIFTNLLHNAIKFSKPHTAVHLTLCREASTWKISIHDEGVGISPEKLAHIFDPFVTERNKENTEGIGLGLHITQQLVAAMDGSIEVESKPGVGSLFTVYLPIIQSLSPNAIVKERELILQ